MESADEELYCDKVESKKVESIKPKSIADMKNALENISQDIKTREEQRLIFMKDLAKEVLIYRERIVEATTLEKLNQVQNLILNRISLMDEFNDKDYPKATETRHKLNNLLRYADSKIANFKPEPIDKNEERKYVIQKGKPEFSHTYIVLKCFYKGIEITNDNSKRIAKIYDYVAINSGKKLKDLFEYYRSDQSRTSYPGPRKFKSMINDLESIIKYLPQEKWKQGNPLNDLQKLKSNGAGYEKRK